MPCRDGGYEEPSVSSRTYEEARERCDKLAQMLCWVCGELQEKNTNGVGFKLTSWALENSELVDWWEKHQETDAKRVRHEMKAQAAKYDTANEMAEAFIKRARRIHAVSDFHVAWFRDLAQQVWKEITDAEKAVEDQKKLRKAALSKLTTEEKRALGLK
jgi:hypothetical protein